ncbi:MAG TPA: TonB-dependent receptor [Gemmatimonadales bacterium]|jgi:hypothetical protein|nr:TonB-dependent receptor [Gemmatimonadales bacterium]
MRQVQGLQRAIGLTLVLSGAVSLPLAAQAITTAALHGVVTGRDSAGIEEAVVTVINTANGERWRTVTAAGGRYVLEYLSLGGPYTVEARAVGYAPTARTGLMLSLGERRRADLSLTPVILELPEIAVAGRIDPALNAGRTGPAQTIDERLTSGLPLLDRDFSQLAFLSPQAIRTTDQGISIAGQSDRLNNIEIDGANNNDAGGIAGTFGSGTVGGIHNVRTLSAEALQEMQILVAPFDVRYGMFAGGLVNAVTRSGSNRWEGTVTSFFQSEGLTGRDEQGRQAQEFSTREVGVTLGGPIVRDRVAFFLDAGLQRFTSPSLPSIGTDTTGGADSAGIGVRRSSAERFQRILRNTYGVDPGSIAASPFRNPGGNIFGKVTIWPGLNQRIEVSHDYAERNPQGGFAQGGYCCGFYSLRSWDVVGRETVNATRATWTAAGQGQFSNELSLSRVADRDHCDPVSHFAVVRVFGVDNGALRAGTNNICTDRYANNTTWEVTNNSSWLLGPHRVTLGTHDELLPLGGKNRSIDLIGTGRWSFGSLDDLEQRQPFGFRRTLPGPGRPEGARSDLEVRQLGLYLQDQWSMVPNLSLTAGVRFDVPFLRDAPARNAMLADSLGVSTAATPSGHLLWSPRLGVNYDVGGRGTTFLRAGAGLFSGRPIYLYFSNVYESTGLETVELICSEADVPAITSLDLDDQPTACASGATAVGNVSLFDRAFRFPRNLRLALGADVRLPWNMVGTADLLYIRGVDQLDFIDLNLAPPTASASGEGSRVLYGTIDPSTGEAFPNRRTYAFGPVVQMRNSSGERSVSATLQLQKRFRAGELSLAYTYTDARDRISPLGWDLASNVLIAPLDGTLDHRRLGTSFFERVHKVTLGGVVDLPARLRLGVFYNGLSGHPFNYGIEGDPNADGYPFNDILYVPRDSSDITLADPTEWAALDRYIRSESCLEKQRGRIMRRNSCREYWQTLLNARLSTVLPTTRGQSVELIADLFNVLSFLDRDWGVQRFHSGDLLRLVGYDEANGRGIYEMGRIDRKVRDNEATRWRLQLGARYGF